MNYLVHELTFVAHELFVKMVYALLFHRCETMGTEE